MKKLFKLPAGFHGSGPICFSWQKGPNGKCLVTTGFDQIVNLHDRYGNKVDSFGLNGICCGVQWNKNGDLLALITERSSVVKIWEANSQKVVNVDFSLKESINLTLWSTRTPNLLAVTTTKGNLLIYDHNTLRRIPILGKHSKKIVSGCWSNQNLLALVCEDRCLSISDGSGDTIFQSNLKAKGSLVKASVRPIEFASLKSETGQLIESPCVSVVLNRRQITLLPIVALDQPLILSFEERFEEIFDYYWQANGQLLIAFSTGFIISVLTTGNQLGQQLVNVRVFPDEISNLNFCESTGSLAVIRKNVIKLMNVDSLEQIDNVLTLEDEQELEWLEWSGNGQMLAVSSDEGSLAVFLMRLPNVSCAWQTKIAYLSSLLELSFVDVLEPTDESGHNRIQLDVEPSLIAICNTHLAACMNNRAYFYELNAFPRSSSSSSAGRFEMIKEKEYSSIIRAMQMNDLYAAVLFTDGRAILHRILEDYPESDYSDGRRTANSYHAVDAKQSVVCIALTASFFIWSTDAGILELFSIDEWTTVSVHRHTNPIKTIAADFLGLRVLLVDASNEAFVFDAASEQLTPVELRRSGEETANGEDDLSLNYEELPTDRVVVGQRNYGQAFPFQAGRLFWDQSDHSTFVVLDKRQLFVYYYVARSVQGSFVQFIGKSNAPNEGAALLVHDGYAYSQTPNGVVTCAQLDTHNYARVLARSKKHHQNLLEKGAPAGGRPELAFHSLLKLRRTEDCWAMCKAMNRIEFWLQFIDCCLHDLELAEAIRIARYIGHAGLVWSFRSIQQIEELNLLTGHVAMYLGWFDLAERLYLKSTQPTCALRLRLDLMQWSACLVLAKRLASDQLPFIHRQQANELEFEEDYQSALEHYQDGLLDPNRSSASKDEANGDGSELARHNQECLAGISRCLVKCGDRKKGVQIALKLDDPELVRRTAAVCEECNLMGEAAALYEKTGDLESACSLYLREGTRNLAKVKELLQQKSATTGWPTKAILVQYAKLQEQKGNFSDALLAYEQADRQLDCVSLLLDKLKRPQEAVKLVRQKRDQQACLLIAKHFQQTHDYESAIEFLVYSGKLDEAFELALQESQMPLYTGALLQILQSTATAPAPFTNDALLKQLTRIAIYYDEQEHSLLNAGRFYCLAGQLPKGIKLLLRAHSTVAALKSTTANSQTKDGEDENENDPLKLAIEFACKSNDEASIQQVIEALIVQLDAGNQTDFQYLFKLYMCSGQYQEATKTALLLAKDEQSNGNYDRAHGLLVEMCKNLLANQLKLSFELLSALHLLHCYRLAKLYLDNKRLEASCELLGRVSNGIAKFPKHAAQILSTSVLESLKLGNRAQAIRFATILLQNSAFLDQLDTKFRRKIETLIRRSASSGQREPDAQSEPQDESVCPFCQSGLPKFQLSCNSCRNVVPFSILTGYHLMPNDDCYACHACRLPFALAELDAFLELKNSCPACGSRLDRNTISKLDTLALVS